MKACKNNAKPKKKKKAGKGVAAKLGKCKEGRVQSLQEFQHTNKYAPEKNREPKHFPKQKNILKRVVNNPIQWMIVKMKNKMEACSYKTTFQTQNYLGGREEIQSMKGGGGRLVVQCTQYREQDQRRGIENSER